MSVGGARLSLQAIHCYSCWGRCVGVVRGPSRWDVAVAGGHGEGCGLAIVAVDCGRCNSGILFTLITVRVAALLGHCRPICFLC